MIYTSNFKLNGQNPNTVSIAAKAPRWYKGAKYRKLAPLYDWWIIWRTYSLSDEWYIEAYKKTILKSLDPHNVFNDLSKKNNSEDIILLCFENPGEFCHRKIVAEWLEKGLSFTVDELPGRWS